MRQRFQVQTGGFYVNEGKDQVRHVVRENPDGRVLWLGFTLRSGKPTGDSSVCETYTISQWADREATQEEVARLHVEEGYRLAYDREMGLVNNVLKRVHDDLLFAEVRRRGRQVI